MVVKEASHRIRLQEIALLNFGELSDEEVLKLLAERKQLEEKEKEYLLLEKEKALLNEKEAEKAGLDEKLAELNKLISPDKPDDELLHLIKERKEIEASLDIIQAEIASLKKETPTPIAPKKKEEKIEEVAEVAKEEPVVESPVAEPVSEEEVAPQVEPASESVAEPQAEVLSPVSDVAEEFGAEKIVSNTLPSDLQRHIDQMKHNPTTLGTVLDSLPSTTKKDKLFMLAVAQIDPAYAMHYADADSLKKDEDFNVRVASMKNLRNSGNALSEMLPEGRTSKVILAAVKNDYKNVRYALPNMADYDEMLTIAKKGSLDAVKQLKEGVDVTLLVPKILQKDKAFMEQVATVTQK